jgi:hypothetical protein
MALSYLVIMSLIVINANSVSSQSFSNNWDLGNNTYLSFIDQATFYTPSQGAKADDALISHWKMNEGCGVNINDSSNNQNNGGIMGASWVEGKYGNALYFDGIDDSVNISTLTINHVSGALSLWVYSSANYTGKYANEGQILGLSGNQYMSYLGLRESGSTYSLIGETNKNEEYFVNALNVDPKNAWNHILINFVEGIATTYINGVQVDQKVGLTTDFSLNTLGLTTPKTGFCGSVDEILIYNRALTINEIKARFYMGEQPDIISFAKFYNFTDCLTNETLLINIEKLADDNNSANIKVLSFFDDNTLVFESNDTITLYAWTTLGQPKFILNGFWNSENFTSIFNINSSSTAKLDWRPGTPPSASDLSVSSVFAGEKTVFSAFWRDNKSLSGGGFIFSSNNTGIWINSTWSAFYSDPSWANATLTLSNNTGEIVSFRVLANNSLGLWGDTGIYSITIKNKVIPTSSPTPTQAPSPTLQPTPKPSPSTNQTPTTPTQKSLTSPITNYSLSLSINTIIIIVSGVTLFAAFLITAFVKGYISIEVLNEEESGCDDQKVNADDYSI